MESAENGSKAVKVKVGAESRAYYFRVIVPDL
jgi:hypothetical protein